MHLKKNFKASKPDNFIGLVLKKKIRLMYMLDKYYKASTKSFELWTNRCFK